MQDGKKGGLNRHMIVYPVSEERKWVNGWFKKKMKQKCDESGQISKWSD